VRWIKGNVEWYRKTGKLVEKYNVVTGIKGKVREASIRGRMVLAGQMVSFKS